MDSFDFGGEIAWRPTEAHVRCANLTRFMHDHGIAGYDELMRRSTTDVGWFWDATIRQLGVVFDRPYDRIVDVSRGVEWPQWCVGGRMNIVKSLLHRWQGTPTAGKPAIIAEHEDAPAERITYADLFSRVNIAAGALRSRGIGPGDAVGVFLPMNADCVVAMLAIIHVGAIFLNQRRVDDLPIFAVGYHFDQKARLIPEFFFGRHARPDRNKLLLP